MQWSDFGKVLVAVSAVAVIGLAPSVALRGPAALAQKQGRNINGAQQNMRERMIREVGGSSPRVTFDPRYSYTALSGNEARIEGDGTYQTSPNTMGRRFRYRCTYRTSNSRIQELSFNWRDGGPPSVRPPVDGDWDYDGRAEFAWRGRVDDEIQIRFRASSARVRTITGNKTTDIRKWVRDPVPRRTMNVRINKLRGRGTAFIAQQPNRNNDYSVVVRIKDPAPGADPYLIELDW